MSVPTPETVAQLPRTRRGKMRRLVGASVAAAVIAGAFAVSYTDTGRPDGRQASPDTGSTFGARTTASDPEMALKAAEQNPRLLINQPGWKATTVYGFVEKAGTIEFSDGGRQLEMNWYPAGQYGSYHEDRLHVSAPEPVKVNGWPGELFRYSDSDFAVMLAPRDGSFVELRTGGAWTRSEFDQVLASVVQVDAHTWLAALPPEIVTPGRVAEQAANVLADIPLPPGFDIAALTDIGTNDAYQFGARVTSRVGCAWIAEWLRAKKAGDAAAVQRASDALRSSHNWKVLHQMDDNGAWPEVFWGIADSVAAGNLPRGYQGSIGCE